MCPQRNSVCGSAVRRNGFTLVELIVATMLFTIVMAAVYTSFTTTIRSWRVGESTMDTFQGVRTSMSLMTRELQCAVPGAERLFEGSEEEVTFYALVPPLDVEEGGHTRVMQVRYRLKNDPKTRDRILVREEAPVEGPMPGTPAGAETGVIDTVEDVEVGSESTFELTAGVKSLDLYYYWVPPVDAGSAGGAGGPPSAVDLIEQRENRRGWGLPQALKIVVTVSDANSESKKTTFTTCVAFQGPTTRLTRDSGSGLRGPL